MNTQDFLRYAAACGCPETSLQAASFSMALLMQMDSAMIVPSVNAARAAMKGLDEAERIEILLTARAVMIAIMEHCGETFAASDWPYLQRLDAARFDVPPSALSWAALQEALQEAAPITRRLIRRTP